MDSLRLLSCSANKARDVIFHHGLAALILDPLPVAHNTSTSRRHRLDVDNFNIDLNRIVHFDWAEEFHALDANERHAGAVNNACLHSQSFGHTEGQTSRRNTLAKGALIPNVLHFENNRPGWTDEGNKLHDVMLGYRSPSGLKPIGGMKLFKCLSRLHFFPCGLFDSNLTNSVCVTQ